MSVPPSFGLSFDVTPGAYRAVLGESPVWDAENNLLWWVDIDGRCVIATDPATGAERIWPTPEMPGFVVLTDTGMPALGMESGIFLFDPDGAEFQRIIPVDQPGHRFNDATIDWTGRLWAGSMAYDATQPTGVLYAIDASGPARPVLNGLRTVNGLAADPARGRLFLSDTNPAIQTVWTAPLDGPTGALGARKVFADFNPLNGRPDGAALDSDGRYWIAAVGGGALHVFSPDGALVRSHEAPFPAPTKPAFFGADLARIAVTSKSGPTPPEGGLGLTGPSGVTGSAVPRWRLGR